jgi:uracil-DNA glycosylase family 4
MPSQAKSNWLTQVNAEIIACTRCPRLVEYRERIAREKRRAYRDCDYWGKPVPGFGDPDARVLILGLAPGAHGSNRTGRPFTGDASGKFMFPVLYETGFANQPNATDRNDGLKLKDIYITAAVRCAPPDNKPLPQELLNCAPYLDREVECLKNVKVVVGLDWLRCLPQLPETTGPAPKPESLHFSARSHVQTAGWKDVTGLVPSLEPEHPNRKVDPPDVRENL